MPSYEEKKLVSKPILDKDLEKAWDTIYKKLGKDGEDFRIVSLHPNKKSGVKWFHASSASEDSILITRPTDPEKKSGIKSKFRFVFWDFEKDATLYNDYVNGDSCEIRYTGSHTSSYVITLIAELL